jgi:hypothetical protein
VIAELYPSDLFRLRRDVRDYGKEAKAGREVIRQAEWIAIRTMCKGISASQALTNARSHIWQVSARGYQPHGAA